MFVINICYWWRFFHLIINFDDCVSQASNFDELMAGEPLTLILLLVKLPSVVMSNTGNMSAAYISCYVYLTRVAMAYLFVCFIATGW